MNSTIPEFETLRNFERVEPTTIYRVIDRKTNCACASVVREVYDFETAKDAIDSNDDGVFHDRTQFNVAKYMITYELLQEDCEIDDPEKEALRSET